MAKEHALAVFEKRMKDPQYLKAGNALALDIVEDARHLVAADRSGLVEACRDWLYLRKQPHSGLAIDVAGELHLTELREDLKTFRADILAGRAGNSFGLFDAELVQEALDTLKAP